MCNASSRFFLGGSLVRGVLTNGRLRTKRGVLLPPPFDKLHMEYFHSMADRCVSDLGSKPMKQRGLRMICFLVWAVVAAPALAHDCRVKDGYLRGAYEGDCDDSETAHGHGEAKGANTYIGDFVNGWPEGKGTYTWENGARLEGTFKKGVANGPGVYVSAKGVRYEGQFVNGKLSTMKNADCPKVPEPVLAC